METESDYLNRRADEEQAAANRAADSKIRDLHLELAARYRQAVSEGSARQREAPQAPAHPGLPSDFRILE